MALALQRARHHHLVTPNDYPAGVRAGVRNPSRHPPMGQGNAAIPQSGARVPLRRPSNDGVQAAEYQQQVRCEVQPPWARDTDLAPRKDIPASKRAPSRGAPQPQPSTPTVPRRRNSRQEDPSAGNNLAGTMASPGELRRAQAGKDSAHPAVARTPPSQGPSAQKDVRPRLQNDLHMPVGHIAQVSHQPAGRPTAQRGMPLRGVSIPAHGAPRPNAVSPLAGCHGSSIAAICRISQEANAGFRSHMEDVAVVVDPFLVGDLPGDTWSYFAVYDGHGGRQAVDYCEAKLHMVVHDELKSSLSLLSPSTPSSKLDDAASDALSRAFHRVDDQLRILGCWRCGCTATVVLAHRTASGLRLHVANVGDSRGIAIDLSYGEIRLTRDHRPNDPAEIQRIESEGGFVARGRVAGQLGVSRALGDHSLKDQGVSWKPFVCHRDASRDTALVIGSDGLWDAMSDEQARIVVDRIIADQSHDQAADTLVKEAYRQGSTDNITCLVAFWSRHTFHLNRPRSGGA